MLEKILVVDDEPAMTEMLGHMLRSAGYSNVEVANDSVEAKAVINQFDPDLVLMDIEMPTFTGLEVLDQLSSRIVEDGLPVMMVTSHDQEHLKRKALLLGAWGFIAKPVDPKSILDCVADALAGRPNKQFILDRLDNDRLDNTPNPAI